MCETSDETVSDIPDQIENETREAINIEYMKLAKILNVTSEDIKNHFEGTK